MRSGCTIVGINVCLIAVGAHLDLPGTRDNDTITRKVRADGNKLCPGKEWRLYTQ